MAVASSAWSERALWMLIGWAPAVLWWLLVTFVELMAARAEADGEQTWEDLFWPRMLKRLDANRWTKRRLEAAGVDLEGRGG